MATYARPDADQATGSWTTTPLWSKVDEGSDGGDTIASDAVGNGIETTKADLRLSNPTDPGHPLAHILRCRWASDSARDIDAICELWEGVPDTGTLIATLAASLTDATEITSEYRLNPASEVISDYTDLYIRLYGTGVGGGPSRSLVVEFCELEVPDALTGGYEIRVSAGNSTSASVNTTWPTGITNGDYVQLTILHASDAAEITGPGGDWTSMNGGSQLPIGIVAEADAYRDTYTTSDTAPSYSVTNEGSGHTWIIVAVGNYGSYDQGSYTTGGSSTSNTTSSITPTQDGSLIIGVIGADLGSATSNVWTEPTNWTFGHEEIQTSGASGQVFAIFEQTTKAAITGTFTCTESVEYAAWAVSLTPAGGGSLAYSPSAMRHLIRR